MICLPKLIKASKRNMQNLHPEFANPNFCLKSTRRNNCSDDWLSPLRPHPTHTSPSLSQSPVLFFHIPFRHLCRILKCLKLNSHLWSATWFSCNAFSLTPDTSMLCVASLWWFYSNLPLTLPSLLSHSHHHPTHPPRFPVLMRCLLNYPSAFYSIFLSPVRDVNVLVCLIKESGSLLYN